MVRPSANDNTVFRLSFSEDTMTSSAAESVLELYLKVLHAMNDNPEDKVDSTWPFPLYNNSWIGKFRPLLPQTELRCHGSASQSISRTFMAILERLKGIWRLVLHHSD